MTDTEIKEMATQTYDLGIKMGRTFANDEHSKDYMILAIMACIHGMNNSEKRFTTMPVINFDGDYFFSLRKEKGWTLRQVEDATGISNAYLSQFENGKIKKPSQNVVTKLINFYEHGIRIERSDFDPKGTLKID
jgi:hypothetical protein